MEPTAEKHHWWSNGGKLTAANITLAAIALFVLVSGTVRALVPEDNPLHGYVQPFTISNRVDGVEGSAVLVGQPIIMETFLCLDEAKPISVNPVLESIDDRTQRSVLVAGTYPIRRAPGCFAGERRFLLGALPPGRYVITGTDTVASHDPVFWESEPFQVVAGAVHGESGNTIGAIR